MTMFDHRASIVAFLNSEIERIDAAVLTVEDEFEETDCYELLERIARLQAQSSVARVWSAQIARGDDMKAVTSTPAAVAVASTTSPLPPLLTVGPMQNRGAQ